MLEIDIEGLWCSKLQEESSDHCAVGDNSLVNDYHVFRQTMSAAPVVRLSLFYCINKCR